jgi:hypothetical protein
VRVRGASVLTRRTAGITAERRRCDHGPDPTRGDLTGGRGTGHRHVGVGDAWTASRYDREHEHLLSSLDSNILDDFDTVDIGVNGPAKLKAKYATYSYNVPGRPAICSLFLSDRRGQQCRWLLSSHL